MTNEELFNVCIKLLPDRLKSKQEGNSKYIFVIDKSSIAEAVIALGYGVAYVSSMPQLEEIKGIFQASNMYANNCVIIGCCSQAVNKVIGEALGNKRYIDTGWRIYAEKKQYYELHPDELKPRIEAFIYNMSKPESRIVINEETGLISLAETGYKNTAEYIIDKYDIVMLDDELRIHREGRIYSSYTEADNDNLLIDLIHNSKKRDRAEVFPYIRRYAPKRSKTRGTIAFLNGVFDIKEKKLKPYEANMYFTACIPHRYVGNAEKDINSGRIASKFFEAVSCGDYEVEKLLYQIIAYCFIEGNPWQKTFFIFGAGGNGKGTFFSLLTAIFGLDKVEFKTWQDLGTPTGRASIIDKLVVLCNDINDTYIKEPQALKTLISCEPQTVRLLYHDPFTAIFNGKIISSGNAIPRVNDTSNGWQRRLILIPFDADFRNCPDVNMADKLTSEPVIEHIICLAMDELAGVLEKGFKTPSRVDELIEEYRLENNPVALFLKECGDNFRGRENAKVLNTIYGTYYTNFCNENGYRLLSKNKFAKEAKAAGIRTTRHNSDPVTYYIE